jgi:hypothetical protein
VDWPGRGKPLQSAMALRIEDIDEKDEIQG